MITSHDRLFDVWYAREALKLVDNPDNRSVEACDVAKRFAEGEATTEELSVARADALAAYNDTRATYNDACRAACAASAACVIACDANGEP